MIADIRSAIVTYIEAQTDWTNSKWSSLHFPTKEDQKTIHKRFTIDFNDTAINHERQKRDQLLTCQSSVSLKWTYQLGASGSQFEFENDQLDAEEELIRACMNTPCTSQVPFIIILDGRGSRQFISTNDNVVTGVISLIIQHTIRLDAV